MVHIWAVKQKQQFQALSWRSPWSSPQDWRHNTPTKNSPSRDVPLQKAVVLEGDYSSLLLVCLYSETSSSALSPSTVCMARPVQLVVICSLSQLG